MTITVRPMTLPETSQIIAYFHTATPEHLEILGVDPTRLPQATQWQRLYEQMFDQPVEQRSSLLVSWLYDDRFLGFSTADKIRIGQQANMHLHIVHASERKQGIGAECVRQTVELYFQALHLKQLFCEPNAFNAAPNRTLQKAGFKYVKTYMTVPGPLNFHQAVNRWVIDRG
ncbi:GNAT family N-acetyltransferase [Bradyrhizobium sp. GCM10027634]|uniref:GNAT family N-acetyltransferase n=1 Tax=unclassified Bradyrhizobium TaxID=2631580 RepID=UPI00188AE6CC|nr:MULTISPECIES: GNAT family protein [unclassified Bradyrhizobium]MDN4999372.1 GNAT family protein [Bradyrhizobium sp. WYCCWR 12677]QOZ43687.1 GNAT family N-acetyltransferase [Bradyrhizobium sp. CCBAU 53340]